MKKIILIFCFLFSMMFFSNKVNADIYTYTEGVGGLTSNKCNSGR